MSPQTNTMRAVLVVLLLVALSAVNAQVKVVYKRGTGCPPNVEDQNQCEGYAEGSQDAPVDDHDEVYWDFVTTIAKTDNDTFRVFGRLDKLFVIDTEMTALMTHFLPGPSENLHLGPAVPTEPARINVRPNQPNTGFEYYEITIPTYRTPPSAAILNVPSIMTLLVTLVFILWI